MRLVTFSTSAPAAARVGVLDGSDVVDLTSAYAAEGHPLTRGMRQLLEEGEAGLSFAKACVAGGKWRVAASTVKLLAPIYDPEKIVCVGMNYREHCTEQNLPIPTEPVIFSKFASAICASGDPIPWDVGETQELDFEVEMVIVVGRAGRHVSKAAAMQHVAGWTVAHDVSARDWQLKRNGGQWLLGKTCDGFAPIGPTIVTRDELPDVSNLGIRCLLNGERVQDSNTSELVFKPDDIIAWITRFVTIKPGDLIFTGTPSGVGCFRKPPLWLKHGDEVVCEIDGIGRISNRVQAVPARL